MGWDSSRNEAEQTTWEHCIQSSAGSHVQHRRIRRGITCWYLFLPGILLGSSASALPVHFLGNGRT
eukprot:4114289-Heterocapsa_arctica.AAC.1